MSNDDYFIDSHCHLFNVMDVPITALLSRFIDKDMMKLYPALAVPGVALVTAATKVKEAFEAYKPFLQFFERQIPVNILRLMKDIEEALKDSDIPEPGYSDRIRILTPLIMDFDRVVDYKRVDHQERRLLAAIESVKEELQQKKYVILPFIGYDLRKLRDGYKPGEGPSLPEVIAKNTKDFFEKNTFRKKGEPLITDKNDKRAGLKLYPPLGFNPGKAEYLPFFRRLAAEQVPVTVHCQQSSYKVCSNEDIARFTHPRNWEKVLADDQARQLRINFAHFGGEEEVDETAIFTKRNFAASIHKLKSEETWTYRIIRLLKDYPNTYADFSAFDYRIRGAVNSLGSLLYLDEQGQLSNPNLRPGQTDHALKDKLLWGSDYPMTVPAFPSYQELFDNFLHAILFNDAEFQDAESVLENMVCANPSTFLNI